MNEPMTSTYYAADQARRSLANYYRRLGQYIEGEEFRDPRNQDQLDRAVELQWRSRILRRELPKPVQQPRRVHRLGMDRFGEDDDTIALRRDLKSFGLKLPALMRPQAN